MQRRTFLSTLTLPVLGLGCGGGGGDGGTMPPDRPAGTLAVANHAAVTAADGSVVVIAGERGQGTLSDAVDRVDPATRQVTRIATLATGRTSHTALALPDGRILVAGGLTGLEVGGLAELIDPARGLVVEAGSLAQSRTMHTMTLLADGRVLLAGGVGRDSAEVWDPATRRWRLLSARMRHMRAGHSATLLADGRVLMAGGDAGRRTGYVFAELWDPRTESFTALDSGVTEQRLLHAAWRTRSGSVLIVGGELATTEALVPLATALRFDPVASRFVAAAGLSIARTLAVAAVGADDTALLIGGQTTSALATTRVSRWSAAGGEQALPDLPGERLWHTAHRLPDGRVMVIGGEDSAGRLAGDILMLAST